MPAMLSGLPTHSPMAASLQQSASKQLSESMARGMNVRQKNSRGLAALNPVSPKRCLNYAIRQLYLRLGFFRLHHSMEICVSEHRCFALQLMSGHLHGR